MSEVRGDEPYLRESAGFVPAQLVRPFIEAAAGTSDFWDDRRRIVSLSYGSLTVGDLRELARACGEALRAEAANEPTAWRCFHCNELFTNKSCAAEHFGVTETDGPPACVQMLTEGEKAIALSRREWRHRAEVAEAEKEQAEYLANGTRWEIRGHWRDCWTINDVWHRFEDIEGRMLSAEAALSAAPRWLNRFLRWRSERLWQRAQARLSNRKDGSSQQTSTDPKDQTPMTGEER